MGTCRALGDEVPDGAHDRSLHASQPHDASDPIGVCGEGRLVAEEGLVVHVLSRNARIHSISRWLLAESSLPSSSKIHSPL